MAKVLIIIGICFIVAGLIWHFSGGNIPLGRLPGDIHIKKESTQIFIPVTTSILISIIFSLIMWLTRR